MQEDYLAGLFVKKEFRCMGVGKQLLDYIKARYTTLWLHVYQQNQRAVAFYQREGFGIAGEGADVETGTADYTMTWQRKAREFGKEKSSYGTACCGN